MRIKILPFIFIFLGFSILWSRLFYLTIIKGKQYSSFASENRIKIIKVAGARGVIYSRNNEPLARNKPEGRDYLYPRDFGHVLGYLGEADSFDLKTFSLELGDFVGKMGIERQYDQVLRGKPGRILVETDNLGKVVREIKKEEPVDGKDLVLTLDLDLQKKAFDLLNNRKGALIATVPHTGEVLALVSSPSFDPNLFTIKNSKNSSSEVARRDSSDGGISELNKVLNDPQEPLFNRAISGLYPPGSTFKIVTAIAGLEEGAIKKETKIEDTGVIKIGSYSYGNWYFLQYGQKEGQVDIVKALQRSNDIFFYKTGEMLGINKLVEWQKYFGLGKALGIDLPGEADGLIPTPQWKKEVKTESWYLGDTYITSIGQGNLLLTPLQVNYFTSVIAGAGKVCVPHLLKEAKVVCENLKIKQENLNLVKEGMIEACQKGGTAPVFFDFKPQSACKTGTAEYGLTGQLKSTAQTHAWFTVFAPSDKGAGGAEIVVTVLLEGAGEGSKVSAPIAQELLKYWFGKKE